MHVRVGVGFMFRVKNLLKSFLDHFSNNFKIINLSSKLISIHVKMEKMSVTSYDSIHAIEIT